MDREIRNLLERTTQQAKRLLEAEFGRQFEGTFDILPDGTIHGEPGGHLSAQERFFRARLVAAVEHRRAVGESAQDSVANFLRECAFTFLNRIVALRMLEARGIIKPSVSKGEESSGFTNEFLLLAPGLKSLPDKGYRLYIESLFDEIGREVGVLFDRNDLAGQLWPDRPKMLELLELLSNRELESVWETDEAIGWVYQYFNGDDERREMRAASSAPRNSREMAVRNQFFTPRYVVEFLTDNSLGRLWYEIRRGQTELTTRCRYLLRNPKEVFLGDPRLTCKALFGESNDVVVPSYVTAAFKGDLSQLHQAVSGHDRWWIAAAIPPDQFARITGEPYSPADTFPPLDRVWRALDGKDSTDVLSDLVTVWMAISHFVLTCSGGPYAIEPFQRLWTAFTKAAEQHVANQQETTNKPIFVSVRADNDPRNIRILDPACGSGHFLLYSFDLLECIYIEAWDAGIGTLRQDYRDKASLKRMVPELILRHNLHGIDIDPRAAQIGSLALWMRAQRSWHELPRAERPGVRKTNIVVAEPMPGESDLLDEFCESLEPKLLGQLVRKVFDRMKIAGDAGSLLRIETDIAQMVEEAKGQWLAEEAPTDREGNPLLFAKSSQRTLFEMERVTADFWNYAEKRVFDALHRFAATAANGASFRRRLFADDAERGFAFIDLCRTRFDVILMNPPFGSAGLVSAGFVSSVYPRWRYDLFPCFISRGRELGRSGVLIGYLGPRTGYFSQRMEPWRREVLLAEPRLSLLADLGLGVLDGALVDVAAGVLRDVSLPILTCIDVLGAAPEEKGSDLKLACMGLSESDTSHREASRAILREYDSNSFLDLEGAKILLGAPPSIVRSLRTGSSLDPTFAAVREGPHTADNERYVRLWWELNPKESNRTDWPFYAKGGEYAPYVLNPHLLLDWRHRGRDISIGEHSVLPSRSLYGQAGLTFTERTASVFNVRLLPAGCVFSQAGPIIHPNQSSDTLPLLGLLMSLPIRAQLEFLVGTGDSAASGGVARHFLAGTVGAVRLPNLDEGQWERLRQITRKCVESVVVLKSRDETDISFTGLGLRGDDLDHAMQERLSSDLQRIGDTLTASWEIEKICVAAFHIPEEDVLACSSAAGWHPCRYPNKSVKTESLQAFEDLSEEDVVDLVAAKMPGRAIIKPSYYADRRVELACAFFDANPSSVIVAWPPPGRWRRHELVAEILSVAVGAALGRGSGDVLGVVGLPTNTVDLASELPGIPPAMADAIAETNPATATKSLVDDPGHRDDIVENVREVIAGFWRDEGRTLSRVIATVTDGGGESLEDLRDWFRTTFFSRHVSQYSRSRRKAPIYWQLSIPSKRYSIWLHYGGLTRDTFWRVLNDLVKPKLAQEDRRLGGLRSEAGEAPTPSQRRAIQEQEALLAELATFRDDIDTVAPLWSPNLNDGVLLNCSPLWKLVPQPPSWQRELRDCWQRLGNGDYDWSQIAMYLWPERVVPRCATDRSLAIAQGLEETFWEEQSDGKWTEKKVSAAEMKALIQERSSKAVKAALDKLLGQSASSPAARRGRSAARRNA